MLLRVWRALDTWTVNRAPTHPRLEADMGLATMSFVRRHLARPPVQPEAGMRRISGYNLDTSADFGRDDHRG